MVRDLRHPLRSRGRERPAVFRDVRTTRDVSRQREPVRSKSTNAAIALPAAADDVFAAHHHLRVSADHGRRQRALAYRRAGRSGRGLRSARLDGGHTAPSRPTSSCDRHSAIFHRRALRNADAALERMGSAPSARRAVGAARLRTQGPQRSPSAVGSAGERSPAIASTSSSTNRTWTSSAVRGFSLRLRPCSGS